MQKTMNSSKVKSSISQKQHDKKNVFGDVDVFAVSSNTRFGS